MTRLAHAAGIVALILSALTWQMARAADPDEDAPTHPTWIACERSQVDNHIIACQTYAMPRETRRPVSAWISCDAGETRWYYVCIEFPTFGGQP